MHEDALLSVFLIAFSPVPYFYSDPISHNDSQDDQQPMIREAPILGGGPLPKQPSPAGCAGRNLVMDMSPGTSLESSQVPSLSKP